MPINLQVLITVSKLDDAGNPAGDPLYKSTSPISADTDGSLKVTIPGHKSNWEVYPEAGQQDWLKFFAVSAKTPSDGLRFVVSDGKYSTEEIVLDQPIAAWGDALNQQFFMGTDGTLKELKKLVFTNSDACAAEVEIYFVRNASKRVPAAECHPKKDS